MKNDSLPTGTFPSPFPLRFDHHGYRPPDMPRHFAAATAAATPMASFRPAPTRRAATRVTATIGKAAHE